MKEALYLLTLTAVVFGIIVLVTKTPQEINVTNEERLLSYVAGYQCGQEMMQEIGSTGNCDAICGLYDSDLKMVACERGLDDLRDGKDYQPSNVLKN